MKPALVYYFAFPHYRATILTELHQLTHGKMKVVSGKAERDSIKALGKIDIPFLHELMSFRIGPLSWEKGIALRAASDEFEVVILGPATLSMTTWVILFLRRFRGKRTYLWGQCGRRGDRRLKRFVQEVMNRLSTGLLVYGEGESVAAGELGTSPHKIHVVNNATHDNCPFISDETSKDIYQRLEIRTAEAIHDQHLVLTFVGRLTTAKHLPVLFEAVRMLHDKYEHAELRVIGGGSEEARLREEYPDSFIKFEGWVYDHDELNRILQESTLVISPFHMGLLAVDALRSGVPVLVPDNPQNGSEVEALSLNINAVRFQPGDPLAIVEAVEAWLRIAPSLREEQYTHARTNALTKWSPKSVAGNILKAVEYFP